MNKRCVIISGGMINEAFAVEVLNEKTAEIVIGVDRGLAFLYKNKVVPTHIVGDFDSIDSEIISYYKNETSIPIREFNPVKDASDTEIALRLAIELGAKEICLLGATGTRLDHVMANIQILKIAQNAGVQAYIMDPNNRISLLDGETLLCKQNAFGPYFSLFPLGGSVEELSIHGAKYPLINHTLEPYDSLCVSNQFKDTEVKITFKNGTIILMETRD